MTKSKSDKISDKSTTPLSPIESQLSEDFEVKLNPKFVSKLDDNTDLITTSEMGKKWLETSMYNFNNNYNQYSALLKESSIGSTLITDEELSTLAMSPQSDLNKIKRINEIARYYINRDDLIGKVYETIESNVNTEIKLSYKDVADNKSKQKILDKSKTLINDFNEQINIKGLLRKCVPLTYSEGNYSLYLRKNNGNYTVDSYPLGVVEVSDYEIAGEPYLLLNVTELVSRLQKVNKKTKKGKALFFDNIDEEIKNNYPSEVYQAYKNKEQYVKLDIKNSGILRINNMNRKYGVTPIFRTFKPASTLDTFEHTDKINAKSKGKKIIFQKLRKELIVDNEDQSYENMAYAHDAFMKAWKNEIVVYTAGSAVESIEYIEPKVESIDVNSVYYYRSKILTNLGISFLDSNNKGAFATAQISIKELMKMINKITEQLEEVIKKWYKVVLQDNEIDLMYCPSISVIDSEMLEMDVKLQLVEILHSKMNCSLETSLSLLGIDIEDEKQKRAKENEEKLDQVFFARSTSYTSNGETPNDTKTTKEKQGGRPSGGKNTKNENKTLEDKNRRGTL